MTSEPKRNRIELLERACRERGLPVTTQRRTIFEMILDREDHPTADQVYDQVRKRLPAISRTTVYRILDNLVGLGLVTKICHPGSAVRYDPKIHQHHHLVCLHCESIIDLEEDRLNEVPWPDVRARGFEIRDYHIHFRGICANCRTTSAAKARVPAKSKRPPNSVARRSRKTRVSPKQRRNQK